MLSKITKIKAFIYTLFVINLMQITSYVSAATLGGKDIDITTPVGGDVLPGGGIAQAGDIKSSFIFSRLIPFLIKYAIRLAVALSVIALIIGGYQFIVSFGNSEKRQKAQKTITYALIGLVISITAYGIVTIITNIDFS